MKMINPRDEFMAKFNKAIEGENNLEVYPEESNTIGYWDEENEYYSIYHFNDSKESVAKRILMDKEVEEFLDKEALASFLLEYLDANSLMVMEKLVFVFGNPDKPSDIRHRLEEEYCDEYALYVGEDNLGVTWVERQICLINVSELLKNSVSIANYEGEYRSINYIFTEGLLQTIFHECRHLLYECNEIVEIGEGTEYASDGGEEYYVEEYGNDMADMLISTFNAKCIKFGLSSCVDKMINLIKEE